MGTDVVEIDNFVCACIFFRKKKLSSTQNCTVFEELQLKCWIIAIWTKKIGIRFYLAFVFDSSGGLSNLVVFKPVTNQKKNQKMFESQPKFVFLPSVFFVLVAYTINSDKSIWVEAVHLSKIPSINQLKVYTTNYIGNRFVLKMKLNMCPMRSNAKR